MSVAILLYPLTPRRFRNARRALGLQRWQMAKKLGLPHAAIDRIENGIGPLPSKRLSKMVQNLVEAHLREPSE